MGDKTILGGGVLLFARDTSEEVLKSMTSLTQRASRERKKFAAENRIKPDHPELEALLSIDKLVQAAAPMITNIWLADALEKTLAPVSPIVTNSDDEDLIFVSVHFPLAPNVKAAAIREVLDSVPELRSESGTFWNWLRVNDAKPKKANQRGKEPRLAFITTMDDGAIVLGTVELKEQFVILEANSVERGRKGRQLLKRALGNLVLEPVVKEQSIDEARQSSRAKPARKSLDLPPEETRQIIHATMEQHYRKQLDEPIPALGNISPRQAARTKKGLEKVVSWLKTLENHTGRVPKDDPMASFDFAWMWKELGVEDQRK